MFKFSIICTIFLSLIQVQTIEANDDTNKIITSHSSEYGLHYVHALNPKETIYSLSKFSGASVQEIYKLNRLSASAILSIGQELIIPVHPESVITDARIANAQQKSLIKVMYQVKKKDNLFQIAKRHFSTDINTIVKRNELSGLTISPNQVLHIGWISLDKSFPVQFQNEAIKPNEHVVQQSVETKQQSSTTVSTTSTPSSTVSTVANPNTSVVPTSHHNTVQTSTHQTATEVVHKAVETVNADSQLESDHDVQKPKYRVVQHTPLHKKETVETVQETVTNQTVSQVSQQTEQVTTSDAPTQVETSLSHSTPANVTTSITTTTVMPAAPNPNVVEDMPATTAATNNTTKKEETIKNRDYPDLSFLSSPDLLTARGIAMWDKNDNEPLNMFILHQDAKIGSYIRIENPMLGRIVLAKVVARLPTNVYDQDVKMVVSSAVATSLGVKDARFLAEMKYIK